LCSCPRDTASTPADKPMIELHTQTDNPLADKMF
jgi:hypothetical protein